MEQGALRVETYNLHASSRRRIVVSVREARPMDLRTRPFYTVRALRRLAKLPAPLACYEAPVAPRPLPAPTGAAVAAQEASAPVPAPAQARAQTPLAPVRVTAKAPAAPPVPPTATPTGGAPPSGPARTPTAPIKNGRSYDWTGLP